MNLVMPENRNFIVGSPVFHRRDGRSGVVDKVGQCTLGIRWDDDNSWSSCPMEDINLIEENF